MRDPFRRDERAGLNGFEARRGKPFDQRNLCLDADGLRFVLQPVARADLDNGDMFRHQRAFPLVEMMSSALRAL